MHYSLNINIENHIIPPVLLKKFYPKVCKFAIPFACKLTKILNIVGNSVFPHSMRHETWDMRPRGQQSELQGAVKGSINPLKPAPIL